MAQLQIRRIIVVTPSVASCKKRLTSILCSHETQLHFVAIGKLIAQPVTIRIAQIPLTIALALIERDACRAHQFVVPILHHVLQPQLSLRVRHLRLVHIYQTAQQAPHAVVERTDHTKFAQRLDGAIAIQILHQLLYLLGREKRQLLELFTRHAVDIQRMLLQFAEQFIGSLPRLRLDILSRHHLIQIRLPGMLHLRKSPQRHHQQQTYNLCSHNATI